MLENKSYSQTTQTSYNPSQILDMDLSRKQRLLIFISLLIITPLGFLSKFYSGIAHEWFNDYGGAILYEIFWCLLIFWFIPREKAIIAIPIWVLIMTCILEILQLWHPPLLQLIRSYLIGRFLIGTTFVWWDFPHYIIGCLLGWVCLRKISEF